MKKIYFFGVSTYEFVIHAQTVFTASVNKNKVGVNEQFSLTIL